MKNNKKLLITLVIVALLLVGLLAALIVRDVSNKPSSKPGDKDEQTQTEQSDDEDDEVIENGFNIKKEIVLDKKAAKVVLGDTMFGEFKKAKKGGFIYTPKLFYKFYRLLAKILPLAWLMPLSKT